MQLRIALTCVFDTQLVTTFATQGAELKLTNDKKKSNRYRHVYHSIYDTTATRIDIQCIQNRARHY